jgi:hypothetical protein
MTTTNTAAKAQGAKTAPTEKAVNSEVLSNSQIAKIAAEETTKQIIEDLKAEEKATALPMLVQDAEAERKGKLQRNLEKAALLQSNINARALVLEHLEELNELDTVSTEEDGLVRIDLVDNTRNTYTIRNQKLMEHVVNCLKTQLSFKLEELDNAILLSI